MGTGGVAATIAGSEGLFLGRGLPLQIVKEKIPLGARHLTFQPGDGLLEIQTGGSLRIRAAGPLDRMNIPALGIGDNLFFVHAEQGLEAGNPARIGSREPGVKAGQKPVAVAHDIAQQAGGFVIQVMPGGQVPSARLQGQPIQIVAFDQTA